MSAIFPFRALVVEVFNFTEPKKVAAFNRWYDTEFVESAKKIKGVASIHRYAEKPMVFKEEVLPVFDAYKDNPEKPARYMTIYRIHSDDPKAVYTSVQENTQKAKAEWEAMDITATGLWDFVSYRQRTDDLKIYPQTRVSDGMPPMLLMVPNALYKETLLEMDDWFLYCHCKDMMKFPGFVSGARYTRSDVPEGEVNALMFYEMDSDHVEYEPFVNSMMDTPRQYKFGRGWWGEVPPQPASAANYSGVFEHWDSLVPEA